MVWDRSLKYFTSSAKLVGRVFMPSMCKAKYNDIIINAVSSCNIF